MPDDLTPVSVSSPAALPVEPAVSGHAALAQLRAYIADRAFKPGERLPPERVLAVDLGLNRADLRRALEVLVQENRLWRHVGKGTFLTDVDPAAAMPGPFEQLAQQVSPADVLRARAALEPAIAREAALHASAAAIAKLRLNVDRAQRAATWREYEALDNEFHRQIAESSGSTTLLALFDQLNTLRRTVTWGRMTRAGIKPPAQHSSFAEHARIVDEIAVRNPEAAQVAMRQHLRSVETRLLG
ncbi:FCD domain-containing protein [Xinfangfangia sp. CPCC 101601]|uniref:FCD domain-containing protein n=1 Tax=Pseudogemmobacter lacusdianii TaxID=3069608 RepID=A0ABU0VW09_9RHOB|nr:FCD domain-containing protein [Xinfangfangia sp. CPCC 101601]MDQ2065883.1 FCD domain-containing protein [Xinfangfangia sp. CPCC 101601]